MTWVLGHPGIFGYGTMMADIQATITYSDGRTYYYDCIKKIFPIGKSSVAGFCGDIRLGLFFIEDLQRAFFAPDENKDWIPYYVVERHYGRRAKWLFNNQIKPEHRRPVQLMIIAAHPSLNNGLDNSPKMFGYILKSPDFIVEKIDPMKIVSIGSGNQIQGYIDELTKVNDEAFSGLINFEVSNHGGFGMILSDVLRDIVRENPQSGISRHFVSYYIARNKVEERSRITSEFDTNGELISDNIPPIYSDWENFEKFMKFNGHNLTTATADA